MNKFVFAATSIVAVAIAFSAQAQANRAGKTPAEVTVTNARAASITGFAITDDAGATVGKLAKPLAAGKSAKVKLKKGAPCTLTVTANFDDDTEGSEGQVNVCADKTIRFTD